MSALELLDWRRRIADLYSAVRAEPDPARAHDLWRRTRSDLLATHPQSPGPGRFHIAAYDEGWRAEVALEPAAAEELSVQTGTDGVVEFDRVGVLRTPWGELDVWWLRQYAQGLWLPVRDSSDRSYGGGRYLLDTAKGADLGSTPDGRLVVDLNFLYAPSCAYSSRWVCPLAPPGNALDRPVEVGELRL